MKKLMVILSMMLVLISIEALAQQKIVVMDPEAVLLNSAFAKQRVEALQQQEQYKQRRNRMANLNNELKELKKEADVNALTWSEEQKNIHRNTMQSKVDELNALANQDENDRKRLLNSVRRELTPILEKVVTELVAEKGFELILNSRAIIFSNEQNTITKMVIDALDQETSKNAKQ